MVRYAKRERGDGITARTVVHRIAETAAESEAAMAEVEEILADPLARLRHRIAQASEAFTEWRAQNPDASRGGETVPGLLLQVKFAGEDMERSLAEGDAQRAAAYAANAGELLALLWFKHNWQADSLRGRKVGRGLSEAAEKTSLAHRPLRERRLARMRELLAEGHKIENAARYCEAEGLGGWQAIQRQWNRWKEKPDT